MKKIIQFTLRVFIVSSLFSSLGIAAEEEKKKSDKKPKKTRQGISRNSKGHKKYRGQGGPCKRRKK